MGPIIAAIDFSDVSERVIDAAISAALAHGQSLRLIHVAAPHPDFVGYEVGPDGVRQARADELRAEHRQIQALAERCTERGVRTTALLVAGATADKLVEEAGEHDASMIVMGSHGQGALMSLLVGSVAESVLRKAACPVLVVPSRKG